MMRAAMLNPGSVTATSVRLTEALSFWGGTDGHGRVNDRLHPQFDLGLAGRVVIMPSGRGSSASASTFAERVRTKTGPAGIVLAQRDAVITVGAVVAFELYGTEVPIVVVSGSDYHRIPTGVTVHINASVSDASVSWE